MKFLSRACWMIAGILLLGAIVLIIEWFALGRGAGRQLYDACQMIIRGDSCVELSWLPLALALGSVGACVAGAVTTAALAKLLSAVDLIAIQSNGVADYVNRMNAEETRRIV